jgi:tetratricopeptide (TPR) repeat protein
VFSATMFWLSRPAPEAAPTTDADVPPPRSADAAPRLDDVAVEPSYAPDESLDPCAEQVVPPMERQSVPQLIHARVVALRARLADVISDVDSSEALREELGLVLATTARDEDLESLRVDPHRTYVDLDTYAAALEVLAARALTNAELPSAVRLAHDAVRAAPSDALPHLILAEAYGQLGQHARAAEHVAAAFALDPEEPAISFLQLVRLQYGPDLPATLDAFDHYLAVVPTDVDVARRRALIARRARELPSPRITRWNGVDISVVSPSTFDLSAAERTLALTRQALTRAAAVLGRPVCRSLTVLVYADGAARTRASCSPAWTGASFDGVIHTDAVRLGRPDHGANVIFHEATHATARTLSSRLPGWLNEGVAQYVAQEEGRRHFASYELMVREHTWVPFSSLESAFGEIEDGQDAGLAYHQALAMVLWLVDRGAERAIARAVHWLAQSSRDPSRVFVEATGEELDGEVLLQFLEERIAAHESAAP